MRKVARRTAGTQEQATSILYEACVRLRLKPHGTEVPSVERDLEIASHRTFKMISCW
jgi:hypothetical protein